MKDQYEQNILTSIETLVDNALSQNNYDKTIQGTIVKITDLTMGKYLIKYQDSTFEAYSADKNTIFSKDDLVYILVPNGDMKKDKTIIGCVGGNLIRNTNVHSSGETYIKIGKTLNDNDNSFSLCSYKTEEKVIYKKGEVNYIQFNESDLLEYSQDADVLVLNFQLRSVLDRIQRTKGNYGLQIIASFVDELNNISEKTLNFDINDINGNPYNINTLTTQIKLFEDIQNIKEIKQISIYVNNFPNQREDKTDDIFFYKISFYAGKLLSEEELNSSRVDLTTPQGNSFKLEDSQKEEKIIEASVKINGTQLSDIEQKKCEFYWFKENSVININSEKYNLYGGNGWECLNDYNIITQQDLTTFVSWTPAKSVLTRTKNQILAKEESYKCVVLYQDQVIENIISLKNYGANYTITIENNEDNQFYYNYSYPILTCKINGTDESSSLYKYLWGKTNSQGVFESLEETTKDNAQYNKVLQAFNQILDDIDNEKVYKEDVEDQLQEYEKEIDKFLYKQRISNNQIININVGQISDYNIYKCSVYYKDNYLGTASYTIYNRINSDLQNYVLKILNADIIYKYDEAGIAPTSASKENPITIVPLDFALYTSQGEEINKELYKDCEVQWILPSENTLINANITTEKELQYTIENQYSTEKNNNEIQLKVVFKGQTFWDKVNLSLIKEGENGTNGTQYVCKILPNTSKNIAVPIINNGVLNYTAAAAGKWFKVQFWKNGNKIFEGTDSGLSTERARVMVQWSVLKNKYNARWSDASSISYKDNRFSYEGYFEPDKDGRDSPANIIKCTITYNEKKYYATIPIITIKTANNYSLDFKSGFLNVVYTSEGTKPSYKKEFFEIEVFRNENTLVNISQLEKSKGVSYLWRICGQIYDLETKQWIDSYSLTENEDITLLRNQKSFIPVEDYNGECVTNGLECSVLSNATNKVIGKIHIPIYLYLNRYSNSALNDWDGNKIEINKEGSYILTPQVGAGKKEEDNSFTGMLMGVIKDALGETQKTGLLGYSKGEQSIFLDAETGGIILGKGTGGQIIIDPKAQKSYLFSHNYWKQYDKKGFPLNYTDSNMSGEGLLIDLATPEIKYGNENFLVDKDGNITCGEMITSEGLLTQLTFSGSGKLGCSVKSHSSETKSYTWNPGSSGGTVYTNTRDFPSDVYSYPNPNLVACFIPKGFKIFKAIISIEHTDAILGVDYDLILGEDKGILPDYAETDTNTYGHNAVIRTSATENIGIYFADQNLLNNSFIQTIEEAVWNRDVDITQEVLLKEISGFRAVRDNPDDFGNAKIKNSIDFSEKAKIHMKPGEVNYLDIRTVDPGRSLILTPYQKVTIQDTQFGQGAYYTTWKSTKGSYNKFRNNETGKCGYGQFFITILGYYDPEEAN